MASRPSSRAFLPASPLPLLVSHAHAITRRSALTSTPPIHRVPSRKPHPAHVSMVDTNAILAVVTAFAGIGGGIALVAWTESQGERTEQRGNEQPCVECKGTTTTVCNVCNGDAKNPIDPSKPCTYCDAAGDIKCFNCAGSGIQPRFLDRLSPDDFMD